MTENSAISAFGLTSVRLDALRKRVGGGPRLLARIIQLIDFCIAQTGVLA
jgi:hypothetical protein